MSNFISIGPCWKFDLWPINFDLWGQIYPRSTVHWMFYQITYDGPACSSRCSDIAKYAHLTPFFLGTGNDLWPQIFVILGNTGQWASICAIVHMISMCCIARGRYEFLKIFRLRPCIWPLWPQMIPDEFYNNFCKGGHADSNVQVMWLCYVISRRSSVFSKTDLFDPCDPYLAVMKSKVIWHMRTWLVVIVFKFHGNRFSCLWAMVIWRFSSEVLTEERDKNRIAFACACIRKKRDKYKTLPPLAAG